MLKRQWTTCILTVIYSHRKENRFPPEYGGYLHYRVTSVSAESMQPKRPAPKKIEEPSAKRKAENDNRNHGIVTLEDLFRKTKAKPCIYYKPLTAEEVCIIVFCDH